jgi:hypothetical protein
MLGIFVMTRPPVRFRGSIKDQKKWRAIKGDWAELECGAGAFLYLFGIQGA